jgi:hypothetical protein
MQVVTYDRAQVQQKHLLLRMESAIFHHCNGIDTFLHDDVVRCIDHVADGTPNLSYSQARNTYPKLYA